MGPNSKAFHLKAQLSTQHPDAQRVQSWTKKPTFPQSDEAEEVKRLCEDISTLWANGAGRSENRKKERKGNGGR